MKKSIRRFCEKFHVSTGVRNPVRSEAEFLSEGDSPVPIDPKQYRSLVMGARYIADKLAHEVLFHTSYLATKQSAPTRKRYEDAIRDGTIPVARTRRVRMHTGYGRRSRNRRGDGFFV